MQRTLLTVTELQIIITVFYRESLTLRAVAERLFEVPHNTAVLMAKRVVSFLNTEQLLLSYKSALVAEASLHYSLSLTLQKRWYALMKLCSTPNQ
jgi:hypothetical protein